MHQFKRKDGPEIEEETLTVGQLKAILAAHPDEMPVLATWEGIFTTFQNYSEPGHDGCRVEITSPAHWLEKCKCLVFDVDQYHGLVKK